MLLYLVRHAKSSWNDAGLADHERPLNQRGLRDAPRMFERLLANSPAPELIVSSDAVRAASTARRLRDATGIDEQQPRFDASLYHAGVEHIVATVRALPDSARTAALVGHNPGMTWAANALAENLELDNLPTCSIVGIRFDAAHWRDIQTGALAYFDYPRNTGGPILSDPETP